MKIPVGPLLPLKRQLGRTLLLTLLCSSGFFLGECKKKTTTPAGPLPTTGTVAQWLTRADGSQLLQQQNDLPAFSTPVNNQGNIDINENTTYQTIDGFGYTLTGSSAYMINSMSAPERGKLLNELFGNGNGAIGVSYLRISLGASDLSPFVFSYDDLPAGQTDEALSKFSLAADTAHLIPVLKEIMVINPALKLMASPWSAPVWMKTGGSSIGGSLQPKYYAVYAQYMVRYIQAMKAKGISLDALTVQNEPQHGGNNPSMVMSAAEQADFVKNHLGPAFKTAGIGTKIIIWDHNCDNPNYPISILNDAAAKPFIAGSAFHLYAGDISALSAVKEAHPDKDVYFTEQWTGKNGSFSGDLQWHTRNVIIGSMRNWAKLALEWNLASNSSYGLATPGGCTECKGAITINGDSYSRNVSYYIIAHAAKFIPPGSVRIASSSAGNLPSVAFRTPAGKTVLLVLNDSTGSISFNISANGKWVPAQLPAATVATYIW